MIRLLFIFVFLTRIQWALIQNKRGRCEWLKLALYKQSRIFNKMSPEDKERLYKFSMRGIVHEFLRDTTFLEQEHENRKKMLLENLTPIRKAYRDLVDPGSKELMQGVQNILSEIQIKEHEYLQQGEWYGQHNAQIKSNKETLKKYLSEMMAKDNSLDLKSRQLKNINELLGNLSVAVENGDSLLMLLEDVEREFQADNTESEIPEILREARVLLDDFLYLKAIDQIESENLEDFKFKENSKMSSNITNLKENMDKVEERLNSAKSRLKEELEKKADSLQSQILNAHEYSEFRDLMIETQNMLSVSVDLELEQMEINETLSNLSSIRGSVNFEKLRVQPSRVLIFENHLAKIQSLMRSVPENIEEQEFDNKETKQNVHGYFASNMTRLKDLFLIRQRLGENLETMRELVETEKELDFIFGKVFGELQGGQSKGRDVIRCFSKLEVSVYSYFMNLTQVVISKSLFYEAFLESLEPEYQTMLIKGLHQDLEQVPLQDPRIIDPFNFELLPNAFRAWVLNYSVSFNQKLNIIFQKQINPVEEEFSLIKLILEHSGFTFSSVMEAINNGKLALKIQKLAETISSVFSLSVISFVFEHFLHTFIGHLTTLFFSWFWTKITQDPQIVKTFNEGKIELVAYFYNDEFDYLDIEESLQTFLDSHNLSYQGQEEVIDVEENYRQLFYQMVEVESCYDVSLYNQVYQNMFI